MASVAEEPRRLRRPTVPVEFVSERNIDVVVDVVPRGKAVRRSKTYYRQSPDHSDRPKEILTKSGRKVLPRVDEECMGNRRGRSRKSTSAPLNYNEVDNVDFESLTIDTSMQRAERPDSALYEGDEDINSKMFGFRTPHRRSAMMQKASESASKASETSKASAKKSKETPAKTFSTPYGTRSSFKRGIAQEANRQRFDDSDDSDYKPTESSESEESSSDMEVQQTEAVGKPVLQTNFQESTRRRPREKISDTYFQATEYFERQGLKSVTSNHKLTKLNSEKFCRRELHKLLRTVKSAHDQALTDLKNENNGNFKRWMLALSESYNVLLYGVGSKTDILSDFQITYLNQKRIVLNVNGYFPGLTLKEIFNEIASDILQLPSISSDPREAIAQIEQCLRPKTSDHIFLLIHNIDGEAIRVDKIQSALAELAALPKVHMIATCDHINAPLLWDQKKLALFNFIMEDVTSFEPYIVETSYENSFMIENPGDMALASLRNVFKSLHGNSKRIFQVLLSYQLKEGGNKNYPGMSFSKLYEMCRNDFIVSSDLGLRTQLNEYLDHGLVKWKRDTDQLVILVDHAALEQFQAEIISG